MNLIIPLLEFFAVDHQEKIQMRYGSSLLVNTSVEDDKI